MEPSQAKPVKKRGRWLIVTFVIGILLVMLAGRVWWASQPMLDSVSFYDFLVQHPSVVSVMRPLFDLSGYGPSFQRGYNQSRIRALAAQLEPFAGDRPRNWRSQRSGSHRTSPL